MKDEKKPAHRPKLEKGKKRDCTIGLRVTKAEYDAFMGRATAAGMSMKDYLRSTVVGPYLEAADGQS